MQPGPLVPQPPPQPREVRSARELLRWIIVQDATGGLEPDPIAISRDLVDWVAATFQRRRTRHPN